jgi:uncharacterized membrane protein
MLKVEYAYWLIAAFLIYAGLRHLRERQGWRAAFWLMLGILFASGDEVLAQQAVGNLLPTQLAGGGVILLALLAPMLRRRAPVDSASGEQRLQSALRLGHRLFVPALLIPIVTLLVALFGAHIVIGNHALFAKAQMTLTGLALACAVALFAASRIASTPMHQGLTEGRRLLDAIGWAALLPLLLAALGEVFTQSGVGTAVAGLSSAVLPTGSALACLLAFAFGMVIFTVIMGNAFAAFSVMMAGIGLPLLIQQHHANPAILGSMGMLCGYCGTLMTPMAADFNLVPAALLELRSPYGVIRAQLPSALAILAANVVLMYLLVFR